MEGGGWLGLTPLCMKQCAYILTRIEVVLSSDRAISDVDFVPWSYS